RDEPAAVAEPAPLGMDRDVQQMDLVGDAPAAGVADDPGTRQRLLLGHHEPGERRRELLLEERPRPRPREGAALDLEDGTEIVASHVTQGEVRDLVPDGHRFTSPAHDRRAPGETGPERGETDERPRPDTPALDRLVERDRDGGGGRVAVALDVVEDLLLRQLEPHRDELADAEVR